MNFDVVFNIWACTLRILCSQARVVSLRMLKILNHMDPGGYVSSLYASRIATWFGEVYITRARYYR